MKISVDGIDYHVEIEGEGYPLVMLHGFTGDNSTWLECTKALTKASKLVMIEMIGHGKTSAPESIHRYKVMTVVDDIGRIMRELHIEKADFIGYSMGGRVALAFAIENPAFVRKLVLESTSPGLQKESDREVRRNSDRKLAEMIEQKGLEWFVDYWENIPLFESQKNIPESIRLRIKEQRKLNSTKGLSNSLIGMGTGAQPSAWNEIENYKGEVLFITGALDKKFVSIAEEMVKKVKNSDWVNVDGCGHAIHVEQPEKFGTIVNGFLSK